MDPLWIPNRNSYGFLINFFIEFYVIFDVWDLILEGLGHHFQRIFQSLGGSGGVLGSLGPPSSNFNEFFLIFGVPGRSVLE